MSTDLRVIKTKKSIENAMLLLLETMPFSKIKMTDIAEKAVVNRNTIYLHYNSKEDIIKSIIKEHFSVIVRELNEENIFKKFVSRKNLKNTYTNFLNIVNDNIELYRIIMLDSSLSGYLRLVLNDIKNNIYASLAKTKKNSLGLEYIINGSYGMVARWIIYSTGTLEEVAELLTLFTFNEFRYLNKRPA